MRKKSILIIISILILSGQSFAQDNKVGLYRVFADDFSQLRDIESRGMSVFNSSIGRYLDIESSEENINKLKNEGFRVEFLANNYRDLISTRLKTGSYEDYHDHQETLNLLEDFAFAFPDITELDTIGYSVLGRAIYCIKISDNVRDDEDEIPVLMVGNHHGNEILSVEATLYQVDYLLNNYGSDQEVTQWIDNMEIWYVPMLNPDGREDLRRTNENGVDLNRNYSFAHTAEGNHGPFGFSEPETQAIRDLAAQYPPALSLTYHTSGRLVLLPWTHTDEAAPDSLAFTYLGNKIAESITFPSGSGTGHYELRQGGDWYFTAGEYCDYLYVTHNTHGYTIEMHTSQTPPAEVIPPVIERNLEGMKTLFREAFLSSVTGRVTDRVNGEPVVAKIDFPFIDKQGKLPDRFSEPVFGRFYKYLAPGTYEIEVSAPGYRTVRNEVMIKDDDQYVMDIEMDPAPNLILESFIFSDTTDNKIYGNSDGKINVGETGGVFISLLNDQLINASGTYVRVSSGNKYVEIQTDSLYFGSIAQNSTRQSPDTLLFNLTPDCPDGEEIRFKLAIHDEISYAWDAEFSIEAFTPDVKVSGIIVSDPSGNNNGIIDAGERVNLSLEIINTGRQAINDVILELDDHDDEFFSVISESFNSPKVGQGQTVYADFEIELDQNCPDIYMSYLNLEINCEEGYMKDIKIQLDNINGFFDQFENGINGWSHASYGTTSNNHDDWQLGLPAGKAGDPSYCFSGDNCWGTDMGWNSYMGDSWNGEYQDNVYNYLLSPSIDCSGMTEVGLRYRRWLNTRSYDIASILVNDNIVWKSSVRGHSEQEWVEHLLDISEYADGNKDVRVKFELRSSSSSALGGWNIDDFLVADKLATGAVSTDNIATGGKGLSIRLFPNPFSDFTNIEYHLDKAGDIEISVYDIKGKRMATLLSGWKDAGLHSFEWHGNFNSDTKAGKGIYYIRIENTRYTAFKPVVVVR